MTQVKAHAIHCSTLSQDSAILPMRRFHNFCFFVPFALFLGCTGAVAETLHVRQLPDALKEVWAKNKPDMNENSRCAAAFDSPYDHTRMIMRCSIYMRMGAEAERRALASCEEERKRRAMISTCRSVRE